MRLLIIEDDELFGSAVQKGLCHQGVAADWFRDGKSAAAAVACCSYECVLLDLGLPDIDGEALLESLKATKPHLPIVVMTARGSVYDRVRLLDLGADDYMVKPVDLDEVAARVRAVARRSPSASEPAIEYGGLSLLPQTRKAIWQGDEVSLTNKEFWLLEAFMRRKGQIVTRGQLEDSLYRWGEEISSNTVEVYVHFLRRKFSAALIQTIRGVGYQMAMIKTLEPV